ncbi:NAD(P)-dependent oxidoreductase [Sulfitobacter guttiformis]|uniref:Putative NADH-flavin reductase n=1 Tax=Sulfitobacter guttiformis TaxID=74349 RepID=A0A420DHE3_9RHOB|nr:NAD(P)H-binding protein [Sulfitobacter guttiformis]KIN72620.1 NAD-dependent epimerase/dehydratase [Sulfitobacter guttiformis KCTC 32187]RKE93648.1 putative NADH-flavin reductase [Sulfitobacter guttiformis]
MKAPILIMGATSGIGALAVTDATDRGLPVRAFARSAHKLTATDLLEPFAGDARSAEDVLRALSGVRAVVYALGIKERLSMLWEEEDLFSESTALLLDAMKSSDTRRLVAVTGFGAGRSREAMSKLESLGHRAILGRPYADKDRQEALITSSGIDWTIARPVILRNSEKLGRMRVLRDPSTWRNGLVSRADVASYLIDAVEDDLDVRADVVLAR